MNYTVVSQDVDEVRDTQNAPAVSMAQFLVERDQMALLPTIQYLCGAGIDPSNARMLYMNAAALRMWKEMGMHPTEIGKQRRPARTALWSSECRSANSHPPPPANFFFFANNVYEYIPLCYCPAEAPATPSEREVRR